MFAKNRYDTAREMLLTSDAPLIIFAHQLNKITGKPYEFGGEL